MSSVIGKEVLSHGRTTSHSSRWIATLLLLVVAGLSGCREDALSRPRTRDGRQPAGLTPKQASIVLAKVGDRTITLGEYAATLERMDQMDRLRYRTPERRKQIIEEMINVELLAQEALRRGLDKKPSVKEGMRQILRDAILKDAHRKARSPVEFTKQEVREYYEKHADEYRIPERRRVGDLVVADEKTARKLIEKAKGATPEQWGKLVLDNSLAYKGKQWTGPTESAGDVGIVGPPGNKRGENPRVPPSVREAVFKIAEVGQVYEEPVKDAQGRWHVVRLLTKTAAHMRSLAEAERTIRIKLSQQDVARVENKLKQELSKQFPVKIDEQALKKVRVPKLDPRLLQPMPDPDDEDEEQNDKH